MPSPFQSYRGMSGGTLPDGYAQMADRSTAAAHLANAGTAIAQGIRDYRHKREQHDLARSFAEAAAAPYLAKGEQGAQKLIGMVGEKAFKEVASGEGKTATYLAFKHAIESAEKLDQEQRELALREQLAQAQMGRYQAETDAANRSALAGQRVAGIVGGAMPTEDPVNTWKLAALASGGDPDALRMANSFMEMQPKPAGMGVEALAQLGFVPTGGQMNPNGSASLQFGPPPAPPATTATPILTDDGKPTGKAVTPEGKVIDLSPPNSEGKTLTQTEVDRISALSQAENDLKKLKAMYSSLGKGYGGPVAGRLKSMAYAGQNPDISALNNAIVAATPNLARGVFREVGVLTDADVRRYQQLLPSPTDTESVRQNKMDQLEKRLEEGKREIINTLRKAGRDVTAFDEVVSMVSGTESAPLPAPAGATSGQPGSTPGLPAGGAPKARKFNPLTNRIE